MLFPRMGKTPTPKFLALLQVFLDLDARGNYELVALAVNIVDFNGWVGLQVLAKLSDIDIH